MIGKIFCLSFLFFAYGVQAATVIQSIPEYGFHTTDDIIFIDVICIPNEPVKAFEFVIEFNQTVMTAVSIVEGDFFAGYDTFLSPSMEIDNENGTIKDIYNLILGKGNVSEPGTLVTIEFLIINCSGVFPISILNDGVTNETQYIPHVTYENAVQLYTGYPPWDINQDGVVNAIDVSLIVAHYGLICSPGDLWDIKIDCVVDAIDVSLLISKYGSIYL